MNILGFNGVVILMVGDVLVYTEAPLVIHQSRRFVGSVFEDAYMGICVHAFIMM